MSDVRKVERPTRAKVDPLAEATKDWEAQTVPEWISDPKNFIASRSVESRIPVEKDFLDLPRPKSPIDAALESLESATHILNGCISELQLRLVAVLLQSTQIADNERKPANCQMEEVILDRCDDVLAVHNRLRGIIERLQL